MWVVLNSKNEAVVAVRSSSQPAESARKLAEWPKPGVKSVGWEYDARTKTIQQDKLKVYKVTRESAPYRTEPR